MNEENQLSAVQDCIEELRMGDRVLVGIHNLVAYIEERMLLHVKENIPETRRLLEAELQSCKDELAQVGREAISPLAIALRDTDAIIDEYDASCKKHLPKLCKKTEDMSSNISDLRMDFLGLVDLGKSNQTLNSQFNPIWTLQRSSLPLARPSNGGEAARRRYSRARQCSFCQ